MLKVDNISAIVLPLRQYWEELSRIRYFFTKAKESMNSPNELQTCAAILSEMGATLKKIDARGPAALVREVDAAQRVFCVGAGRSGILLQAFCMRLNQLGKDSYLAGGIPCPPAGPGDLIVAASGSGTTSGVAAILERGKESGARIVVFTAKQSDEPVLGADLTIIIPAPAGLLPDGMIRSHQPMRTLFEQLVFLICEAVVCTLKDQWNVTDPDMASRHANLE